MKTWGQKTFIFLASLGASFAGLYPAAGCTGGCAGCLHCAGLGGAAAVLVAIGALKKRNRGENAGDGAAEP